MIDKCLNLVRRERERKEQSALFKLKARYHAFRIFLDNNGRALELIVDLDGRLFNRRETELTSITEELMGVCCELVDGLNLLSNERFAGLYEVQGKLAARILKQLDHLDRQTAADTVYCVGLDDVAAADPSRFGNKAAVLAKLRQLGLPVPDGFMCATMACREFLGSAGMASEIRSMLKKVENDRAQLSTTTRKIREMILAAKMPSSVEQALSEAYEELRQRNDMLLSNGGISVRSSGVTEDSSDFSFAGQYSSILNVQRFDALLSAYREVIASGFSSRAVSYRRNAGIPVVDLDLAVLCQVMLDPCCAGVMFTHDPSRPDSGRMVISAVPGLGKSAVDGSAPADVYRPWRIEQVCEPDFDTGTYASADLNKMSINHDQLMADAAIAHKTTREIPAEGGGLDTVPLPLGQADEPLLSPTVLEELIRIGGIIESLGKTAQDIEWAWSKKDGIAILQARPLRLAAPKEGPRLKLPSIASPLVSGTCASSGTTIGQIRSACSTEELHRLQDDLSYNSSQMPPILVMPQSIVDAASIIKHCGGVIIDIGNPTDHLSCIAREYGIPMITGTGSAMGCLKNDEWIIIDADRGLIFRAPESIRPKAESNDPEREKNTPPDPEQEDSGMNEDITAVENSGWNTLRQMIVPLNLTDEFGPTFSFTECRSAHDLVRYTHEMAVLSMFDAGDQVMQEAGNLLHPLEMDIPFSFLVIDLGGGIRKHRSSSLLDRLSPRNPVTRDDIRSLPLAALCEGLTNPEINWHSGPDSGAVQGIFSRTMLDGRSKRPAGSFNYALTARDYLNLNARMEFHFAMLDSVCGRDTNANYIRFRFKGGGASAERSRRRAVFLKYVLEKNAFYTSVVGDLVTASLLGASKENVYQRLVMLGHLFGFSRFLDGVMTDDEIPVKLAEQFLDGNFSTRFVA